MLPTETKSKNFSILLANCNTVWKTEIIIRQETTKNKKKENTHTHKETRTRTEKRQRSGPKFNKNFHFLLAICEDKTNECARFSAESCNSDWMKENCQKSCALCEGLCTFDTSFCDLFIWHMVLDAWPLIWHEITDSLQQQNSKIKAYNMLTDVLKIITFKTQ